MPFAYDDPYVNEHRATVENVVDQLTQMGFHGDARLDLGRTRRSTIDRSNPATRALVKSIPTIGEWLDLVPRAAALAPAYAPFEPTYPGGVGVSEAAQHYFANVADCRGIRSRAAVLQEVAIAHARTIDARAPRWLSLACGAAQPAISAVSRVRSGGGRTPKLTLVDLDRTSLALAQTYATQANVTVSTRRANVLARGGVRLARPRLARTEGPVRPRRGDWHSRVSAR